jgi:hypothetical protein
MTTPSLFNPRRTRPSRRQRAVVLALLVATIALSACGGHEETEPAAGVPDTSTPSLPPNASPAPGDQDGIPIRISVGDTQLTGRLSDNATARDLADQLPLRLSFRDHNSVEKTAPLPRELPLDGAPDGHDPVAGHIGYWAPGGDLVFYYDDGAPYFDGIVHIGEFDGDLDALERQGDDFDASIELAE